MRKLSCIILLAMIFQVSSFAQNEEYNLPDSIVNALENCPSNSARRLDVLDDAINHLFNDGDFLEAIPFIKEMNDISENTGDNTHKAMACFYSGNIDLLLDSLPEAYKQLITAKLLISQVKDSYDISLLMMRTNISLASYYITTKSNYTEAYKCLVSAKEQNKTVMSDGYEDIINSNLIKVLNSLGLNEEAINLGKEVSANSYASNNRRSSLFINIASNYMNIDIDTARIYLDSAFMFAHNRLDKAKITYNVGLCHLKSGDNVGAKKVFGKCLNDYSGMLSHELTSLLYIEKGRSHFMLHEYDSALLYINKGISSAHDYGFSSIELDGRSCKCEILESMRDYRRLAESLKTYYNLKDSINELNNADNVAYMMLESQFKEVENQKAHDAQVNKAKRVRLIYVIILITLVFVSATVIFSLILSRKHIMLKNKELREKALADELEKQNREMVQQTLVQQQRDELMSDIVDKLKDINDDNDGNIDNVLDSLKDYSKLATPEDFEYYFTKTHPDFYKNLSNDYPDLSPSELKLCAYIKLNLSAKDIANICNIATSSVHQARYRLKKTLGLENTDDINEVIAKY